MDLSIIAEAFVVVVVGGLGSVAGAYLAALLIGVLHAFGILILPKITPGAGVPGHGGGAGRAARTACSAARARRCAAAVVLRASRCSARPRARSSWLGAGALAAAGGRAAAGSATTAVSC